MTVTVSALVTMPTSQTPAGPTHSASAEPSPLGSISIVLQVRIHEIRSYGWLIFSHSKALNSIRLLKSATTSPQ